LKKYYKKNKFKVNKKIMFFIFLLTIEKYNIKYFRFLFFFRGEKENVKK